MDVRARVSTGWTTTSSSCLLVEIESARKRPPDWLSALFLPAAAMYGNVEEMLPR